MNRKYLKYLTNRFVIAIIVFIAWTGFFDDNSLLYQHKLNKQIKELEKKKAFYTEAIKKQKQILKDLDNDKKLEKYVREKLLMKHPEEDIYIIETNNKKIKK